MFEDVIARADVPARVAIGEHRPAAATEKHPNQQRYEQEIRQRDGNNTPAQLAAEVVGTEVVVTASISTD